jgi:hypothetical protein
MNQFLLELKTAQNYKESTTYASIFKHFYSFYFNICLHYWTLSIIFQKKRLLNNLHTQ